MLYILIQRDTTAVIIFTYLAEFPNVYEVREIYKEELVFYSSIAINS